MLAAGQSKGEEKKRMTYGGDPVAEDPLVGRVVSECRQDPLLAPNLLLGMSTDPTASSRARSRAEEALASGNVVGSNGGEDRRRAERPEAQPGRVEGRLPGACSRAPEAAAAPGLKGRRALRAAAGIDVERARVGDACALEAGEDEGAVRGETPAAEDEAP